jgi:hypothetical protein
MRLVVGLTSRLQVPARHCATTVSARSEAGNFPPLVSRGLSPKALV